MAHDSADSPRPLPASPPEAWEPLLRMARLAARPLDRFLQVEAASGILLLLAAAVALAWANSSWAHLYAGFWHTPLGIRVGSFTFERSLEWVVNDGLMVIFFFVVGLEIRREVHQGELSEWRRAALPAAAALGGMLAPAGLYLTVAAAKETHSGWGVPMATDIAFAVGVLALLGNRVPPALRVLLLALAVIDDLGAILVIAFFYSSGIAVSGLAIAALGFGLVLVMQRLGVRTKSLYLVPGLIAWAGIYAAGIHPTIAGVILGVMTPVRAWFGPTGFVEYAQEDLARLSAADSKALSPHALAGALRRVNVARREAMSPLESLIESLHPWVAFAIMPIFALANAGVTVQAGELDAASWNVLAGVSLGLVLGKPAGVLVACFLVLKAGVATLPTGIGYRHLLVLGMVAGIGFTMALFVAQLAFSNLDLLAASKLGILGASAIAGVGGLLAGKLLLGAAAPSAALSADEAEHSTAL
jgi:NhaA family Na+:H+ antiporter